MSEVVLALEGVRHGFIQGGQRIDVLRGSSLALARGELVGLIGPSGAGKSTLLHIAGLLETPEAGEVRILGRACTALREKARTAIRRDHVGFVYQFHHLLEEFSALENVALAQRIAGVGGAPARTRARALLAAVGLEARLDHRPGQLSGGEAQRVAIARALANRPAILLADEPTGNLDAHTADAVFAALLAAARDAGLAGVIATHNEALAARLDRIVRLRDGRLADA